MSQPDQYMTVVFRDLPIDQRREIINMNESVRLSHGDQLAVRDRLDRIATEAADLNNRQAKAIALYEKALLASWPEGSKGEVSVFWGEARRVLSEGGAE